MKKQTITKIGVILSILLVNALCVYISLGWAIRIGRDNIIQSGTFGYFGSYGWPNAHQLFDNDILEDIDGIFTNPFRYRLKSPNILFVVIASFLNLMTNWDKLSMVITSMLFFELTVFLLIYYGLKKLSLKETALITILYQTNPLTVKFIWSGNPVFSFIFSFLLVYIIYFKLNKDNYSPSQRFIATWLIPIIILIIANVYFALIVIIFIFILKGKKIRESIEKNWKLIYYGIIFIVYVLLFALVLDAGYNAHVPLITSAEKRTVSNLIVGVFWAHNIIFLLLISIRSVILKKKFTKGSLFIITNLIFFFLYTIIFSYDYFYSNFIFSSIIMIFLAFESPKDYFENILNQEKQSMVNKIILPLSAICWNFAIIAFLADISLFNRILTLQISYLLISLILVAIIILIVLIYYKNQLKMLITKHRKKLKQIE